MHDIDYETFSNIRFVSHNTGVIANTILDAVKSGPFPLPVDFNGYEVWLSSEIANWLESQPLSPSTFEWEEAG